MSHYSAQGSLLVKNDTRQVSEKFRVREFVLQIEDGKYPQTVQFQLAQDRCELLDQANVGDVLDIDFNLRGREYTKKDGTGTGYFNSLDVWRLKVAGTGHQTQASAAPTEPTDDIPF